MKKSELMQYRDLIFEIRKLENRIRKNERKIERDSVSGSNPDFPYEPMIFKIEGYGTYSERNKRLRAILEQRKNQAEELKIRIEEFIAQIPDCRTRLIFEMRYIECMSWQRISLKMGSHDESYARKIHERFLKSIDF